MNNSNTVIITFSEYGRHVARTLQEHYVDASVFIKPLPFADTIRSHFQHGKKLILITPTGIAIRCLGDLITDDIDDPMVLVIDESAEYVLPLFADYDGDAVQWAEDVAKRLNASVIKTHNKRKAQTIYTLGISCTPECSVMQLQNLLIESIKQGSIAINHIKQLACSLELSEHPSIKKLARNLNLPIEVFDKQQRNQVKQYHPNLTEPELVALAAAHQISQQPADIISHIHQPTAQCALAKTLLKD